MRQSWYRLDSALLRSALPSLCLASKARDIRERDSFQRRKPWLPASAAVSEYLAVPSRGPNSSPYSDTRFLKFPSETASPHATGLLIESQLLEYVKVCSLYGEGFFYVPGTIPALSW